MKFSALVPIALSLAMAGCSLGQEPPKTSASAERPSPPQFQLLRYLSFGEPTDTQKLGVEQPVDEAAADNQPADNSSDWRKCETGMYSRILITGTLVEAESKEFREKPLARDFWGQVLRALRTKTKSVSLITKTSISDIGEPITSPLLVIYEEEGINGQMLNTEVIKSSMATPLLRIEPDTLVSLNFEFKSQSAVSSQGLKITLNVLKQATGFLAGGSQLFTALSKDSVKEESRLMDKALSQLFAQSHSEKVLDDRRYMEWFKTGPVKIHLVLDDPKNSPRTLPIGTWHINTTPPRPTIFSNQTIENGQNCINILTVLQEAYETITPEQVLSYQLTNQLTLGNYMEQQSWYTTAIAELNDDNTRSVALNKLCSKATSELYKLGLNKYDSIAGLWALLKTAPINENLIDDLNTPSSCKDVKKRLTDYGLS